MAGASCPMETDGVGPEVGVHRYPTLPPMDDDEEWLYVMRRTMQEIVPGLFLGPYAVATNRSLDAMLAAGLTHVVCVRSNMEASVIRANHPDRFQYLLVQMDDSPLEAIIPKIKTVSSFIDNCLKTGGKVLVHGNAGMSRSAALVLGYIMGKYGVTFNKAYKYLLGKRFCIAVSDAFRRQLNEYEPISLAMQANRPVADMDVQYRITKRTIDEVEDDEDDGIRNGCEGHRPRMEVGDGDALNNEVEMAE